MSSYAADRPCIIRCIGRLTGARPKFLDEGVVGGGGDVRCPDETHAAAADADARVARFDSISISYAW